MTTEQRWRIIWAAWCAAFIAAETIACRSGHPHAPMSHHMRGALLLRKSKLGGAVIVGASAWLLRHLMEGAQQ